MKQSITLLIITVLAVTTIFTGCQSNEADTDGLRVVATTTMLADLANVIGGDLVQVEALMGPGIDPHLYKASAGDVTKMTQADLVVFNGLHLEGKMGEIFEQLEGSDKIVVEIVKGLEASDFVVDEATGAHDPHIWFDVALWEKASQNLLDGLVELSPENEATFKANYQAYRTSLQELHVYVQTEVEKVAEESRILVAAHDAFAYFGKAYGFQVLGLQGISTTSEAGTSDVTDLANFIVEHNIKAIFVESSVPRKNIEALQEAVAAQGFQVEIGGELFSDSLGSPDTEAASYLGTVKSNIDTIVNALQ